MFMDPSLRAAAVLLLAAAVCFPAPVAGQASPVPSIRRVEVLPTTRNQVEIEIEASERIVPQINVLTGPDRLVVDFVNASPGAQLRGQALNRGEVKSLRVGLFSKNPPVTRIVLDLNGPQHYQVFPSGRTVIVKVGGGPGAETAGSAPASGAVLVNTGYPGQAVPVSAPPPPAKPPLVVLFQGGLLSISSNRASLSEILSAVHQRTGAEIAIPAGAEQEKVVTDLGPAPAPEVLAHLLNGSQFNYLILSSSTDPSALDRVILSARSDLPMPTPLPQAQSLTDDNDEPDVQPRVASPPRPVPGPNPSADGQSGPYQSPVPPNNDPN
jgi:AMIN domain